MLTICDTNILLFWADRRERLTIAGQQALDNGRVDGKLDCAAISFWEIALLFRKNRLVLTAQHKPTSYMEDIVASLELGILSITPAIAVLAVSGIVMHGDPSDRLIAATAIAHHEPFIAADKKLHETPRLSCIW